MPRIMFVGDINLGEYYTSLGHGPRTYAQTENPFKQVAHILANADIVAGNLEAPLTTANYNPEDPESVALRGDPCHAQLLYETGFRVLQVANNHTLQHGPEGFNETLNVLTNAGIKAIGRDPQDVTVLEVGGIKIGFLAASDVPDNTDKNQEFYRRLDPEFCKLVTKAISEVDHLFLMLHWGLEAATAPLPYQRQYISEVADLGVRGVIGHHPHLFYPIWQEKGTIAAPSLGNFVFDLCWDERLLQTGILDIEISDSRLEWRVWPIEIRGNGCVPTPTGEHIPGRGSLELYKLGSSIKGEQIRKLRYFFSQLHKGSFRLKARFITRKVKNVCVQMISQIKT